MRWVALIVAVAALAGCNQSDAGRTDLVDVDGVSCAVVRDGLGRIRFLDCDWSNR